MAGKGDNWMIILDLFLIAVWYFCYRLDAEKLQEKSKLFRLRVFYLTAGILGQVLYWHMMRLLSQWDGMN